MATITWSGNPSYTDGFASSDLNSLANLGQKTSTLAGPHIDNSTAPFDLMVQFELTLGANTPATGGSVLIVCVPQLNDGTNYATSTDGTTTSGQIPFTNYPHVAVALRSTSSTAQTQQSAPVPLPPGKYNLVAINRAGVALAASGNMIRWRKYSESVS